MAPETEHFAIVFEIAPFNVPFLVAEPVFLFVAEVDFEAAWVVFVAVGGCVCDGVGLEERPDEVVGDGSCLEHGLECASDLFVVFVYVLEEELALRNLLLKLLSVFSFLCSLELGFESCLDVRFDLVVVVEEDVGLDLRFVSKALQMGRL